MMPRFVEVRSTSGSRILNVDEIALVAPALEGGADIYMNVNQYRYWTGKEGQTYEEIIALMVAAGAVVHRQESA